MNGTIERGPYGAQYLVSGLADSVETAYQMDVMMLARPEFLLPVYRQATVHGCRYAYPVTGLDCLTDRVEAKNLDRKQAARLVQQLKQDLDRLQDHLLTPEQVLLQPEALFMEPTAERLLLVYRPFLPVDGAGTVDELVAWLGERLCRNRWQRHRWDVQMAAPFMEKKHAAHANAAYANLVHEDPIKMDSLDLEPDTESACLPDPSWLQGMIGPHSRKVILLCLLGAAAVAAAAAGGLHLANSLPSGLKIPGVTVPDTQSIGARRSVIDWRLVFLGLLTLSIPVQLIFWKRRRSQQTQQQTQKQTEPQTEPQPAEEPGCGFQTWMARLNPAPLLRKAAAIVRRKSADSPASQERMHDMPTQLLSSRQELFRLATLSEGMPGTNAETAGQRAFILNDEFIVGRDFRTVDLCLTGYAVGRQHARITRQGAAFFITDMGSKNGTRLDGERLNKLQPYLLPDRCQLQFADRLFYFEAELLPVGA